MEFREQSDRLERARQQYGNLLMTVADSLIEPHVDDGGNERSVAVSTPHAERMLTSLRSSSKKLSFLANDFEYSRTPTSVRSSSSKSPLLGASAGIQRDNIDFYPPQMSHSQQIAAADANISEDEKENIILALQDEVNRLKEKLNRVLESAEAVLQETQSAQAAFVDDYESRLIAAEASNRRLEWENRQLKVTLELVQAERDVERSHLLKATRFVDRLKRRGREYLDVQRKAAFLLESTAAQSHHRGGLQKQQQRSRGGRTETAAAATAAAVPSGQNNSSSSRRNSVTVGSEDSGSSSGNSSEHSERRVAVSIRTSPQR